MQEKPEKTFGNYNERRGVQLLALPMLGIIDIETLDIEQAEHEQIVHTGIALVEREVDRILGHNRLTTPSKAYPSVKFINADPMHPGWAGYFTSSTNEIVINKEHAGDRRTQTKIFIHEYIHYLSHNGLDDYEVVSSDRALAQNNNVGFRRGFGLDIREGIEGQVTSDYFLSWNEAVTEQLAIDIFPDAYQTYGQYRGLLNQVVDDVVKQGLGTKNTSGVFRPWTRAQTKDYIYRCFFKGDLQGFTRLLQTTYSKYDISEQQFGLMTQKEDLPSVIEATWVPTSPSSPPPSPIQIAATVQRRLNQKTPDDYQTDVISPEPSDGPNTPGAYGAEYDDFVRENRITYAHTETASGVSYDLDSSGYIIYRGDEALQLFADLRNKLDELINNLGTQGIDANYIADRMDVLLFETNLISMLSEGFRDFYIYKHMRLDSL